MNLEGQENLIEDLQEAEDNYLLKSRFYYLVYLYNKTKLEKRTDDIGTITQRLLAYIEENYRRKISLKTISRDLGYNYNYLSTLFNQRMKTNFQDFLNEYRINRFCLLLKEDHKTRSMNLPRKSDTHLCISSTATSDTIRRPHRKNTG